MIDCIYKNKVETTETHKNDLKVKWSTSKKREKAEVVNGDFIFKINTKTPFVSPEDAAVASDEVSDIESDATIAKESGQSYNLE